MERRKPQRTKDRKKLQHTNEGLSIHTYML